MAQQEDFTKKFRRYFKRIGPFRFFFSLFLILIGIGGKYIFFLMFPPLDDTAVLVETTGTWPTFSLSYLLSFWPLFWAFMIFLSLLWWVLSGFKSAMGVIVSFIVGIFMTEAMMPGTLFSFEELPVYITLLGLLLFSIPTQYIKDPLSVFHKPAPKMKHRFSSSHKKRRSSGRETIKNGINFAGNNSETPH